MMLMFEVGQCAMFIVWCESKDQTALSPFSNGNANKANLVLFHMMRNNEIKWKCFKSNAVTDKPKAIKKC